MFIRWIVRGHKNAQVANMTFHDAYLVESFRDEAGSPRQRTIAYLGNIRQIGEEFPGIERELFLLRAEVILDSIPEVSDLDRRDALGQLHEKVPPLNADQIKVGFYNTLRWYFRWWHENGGMPSQEEILNMLEDARQNAGLPTIDWQ